MKRLSHTRRSRDKLLHIETELGIVNIRIGLKDMQGRPVTSIEIIPDEGVTLDGLFGSRLIGQAVE